MCYVHNHIRVQLTMTEKRMPTMVCKRFKPHFLMTMAQIGYTILYFITEAAFSHGQNPSVYITYRHIVASIVMFPFAYFLERKERPKLTWPLFIEIFVLSLLGVGLTMNLYFASLKYTSPTFLASAVNSITSLTFVIAVILGMEELDIGSVRGIAKIFGTIVSLAGVLTMSIYKGEKIRKLGHRGLPYWYIVDVFFNVLTPYLWFVYLGKNMDVKIVMEEVSLENQVKGKANA